MFASRREQENIVRPATGKTAKQGSTRFGATPLRAHDENATFPGKAVLGTKNAPQGLTPTDRPRVALGNKTNAKEQVFPRKSGVKAKIQQFEAPAQPPASLLKPKPTAKTVTTKKIAVCSDADVAAPTPTPTTDEFDIETAPAPLHEMPYESDIFPNDVLTFAALRGQNDLDTYYQSYFHPSHTQDLFEEDLQKALQSTESSLLRDIQNDDWSVPDVPESKQYLQKRAAPPQPSSITVTVLHSTPSRSQSKAARGTGSNNTLTARKAAKALSSLSVKQVPAPLQLSPMEGKTPGWMRAPRRIQSTPIHADPVKKAAAAEALSRSTLGYHKGRSASSAVKPGSGSGSRSGSRSGSSGPAEGSRPASALSKRSVSYAGSYAGSSVDTPPLDDDDDDEETLPTDERSEKVPEFLSIFDPVEEGEAGVEDVTHPLDLDDEDFQLPQV